MKQLLKKWVIMAVVGAAVFYIIWPYADNIPLWAWALVCIAVWTILDKAVAWLLDQGEEGGK